MKPQPTLPGLSKPWQRLYHPSLCASADILALAQFASGLAKPDAGPAAIQLQLVPNQPNYPANIMRLLRSDRSIKLTGQDKLLWQRPGTDIGERIAAIGELYRNLWFAIPGPRQAKEKLR